MSRDLLFLAGQAVIGLSLWAAIIWYFGFEDVLAAVFGIAFWLCVIYVPVRLLSRG